MDQTSHLQPGSGPEEGAAPGPLPGFRAKAGEHERSLVDQPADSAGDAEGLYYELAPGWRPPPRHNPMAGAPTFDVSERHRRSRGDEPRLLQIPYSPSSLIQAASLWLSLIAITRSDASTLAADDPWEGSTGNIHAGEKGATSSDYLGNDGVELVGHYWDIVAPLRATDPARSVAHCEGCGSWWYIPGGTTKPPQTCVMTRDCTGTVHKAYKVVPTSERDRIDEAKKKRNGSK